MADEEREEPREGAQPTTGRLARTAKFGGLVAGQSVRWTATRTANRLRSDDKATKATEERVAGLANELVKQLGQMRGAAMKIGQVLSTIDFTAIPESEREHFKQTLAALRDDVPPVPFKKLAKLVEEDLGGPIREYFDEFDEEAFAAASIGQVHRAVTKEGRHVAVKIQYPGVAEAVETDLRNAQMLFPIIRRLAPGLDVKALGNELRERIAEELDYEIEAQNQRAVARAFRDHPFFFVPAVDTSLSSRRVLVTDFVDGMRFGEVKQLPEAERDRFGEIVFRFFFTLLMRTRRCSGDPHPGNYLLMPDGRVAFLDFGLMRVVDEWYLEGERAMAQAVVEEDPAALHAKLAELGYLPKPDEFDPQALYDHIRTAGGWYFEPGFRRLDPKYVQELIDLASSPRSPWFEQMRRQTLPPQALLIRRMEGLVFSTLGELRAGGDWNGLAREFFAAAPPSTPLGEEDRRFWEDGRVPARA